MSAEAFPLAWPKGYDRTKWRKRSQFKTSFGRSVQGIINELKLLGASYPVISTNIKLRRDGLPRADEREPYDPGVACYFLWKGSQRVLACDRWDRVVDNLHAIELAVGAMRGLDRWGVSQILDRAFSGFTALPAPESTGDEPWWRVLGVLMDSSLSFAEEQYRMLAFKHHPDRGGSAQAMARLNRAIEEARRAAT